MRVRVDESRCQGHGRCYATAPELFEPDDIGNGHERDDGAVPAGLEDKARLAVANCPESAIDIEENG
ncbi:MAG: ferredoxin [Actinobacteria bacterium]|nr:ferredoxin [Actinomycetota bacterium]MBV9255986.1 ferredoxin [Actinomycetota bacterium]MBV9933926.1 ferredoxin [Actinomycetota bacterium]